MPYRKTYEIPLAFVDEDELLQRMRDRTNFIIVDTVWTHGGNRYRIKGATTIPYPEVLDRRHELMRYDEIIIYCTKKTCPGSKIIAKGLKLLNVPNVKVYEGGIRGWMEQGLPVEEYSGHPIIPGVSVQMKDHQPRKQNTGKACEKVYVLYYKCLTRSELLARIREKSNIIIVDSIGLHGGNKFKIHGAKTISFPDIIDRRNELRHYDEIILYCQNKASDAARKRAVGLQLIGFENVKVYDAGLDDWMENNLPVEEY